MKIPLFLTWPLALDVRWPSGDQAEAETCKTSSLAAGGARGAGHSDRGAAQGRAACARITWSRGIGFCSVGPPGNGKTSCAEAIAAELSVPLLVLRYETVITSFLGETGAKISSVMESARRRHCVLFLDEFDTLAKERGDEHDTGEIKRVVSTLLLLVDQLPSYVVICAATNHSELLDRAVWRRFQVRVRLEMPSRARRADLIRAISERLGINLAKSPRTIAERLGATSYAEIEEFLIELRRRQVLSGDLDGSDPNLLEHRLRLWKARADGPMSLEEPAVSQTSPERPLLLFGQPVEAARVKLNPAVGADRVRRPGSRRTGGATEWQVGSTAARHGGTVN